MPLPKKDTLREKPREGGARQEKNRRTRVAIAREGLRLFETRGYDETTLEAVARAAGVAPRTLYHHFQTKLEILLFFHDENFISEIAETVEQQPSEWTPMQRSRECLLALVPRYECETMVETYRIWNSTSALQAQKQLMFLEIERALLAALQNTSAMAKGAPDLRAAAAIATAALRLAMDAGRHEAAERPVRTRLLEAFEAVSQACRDLT